MVIIQHFLIFLLLIKDAKSKGSNANFGEATTNADYETGKQESLKDEGQKADLRRPTNLSADMVTPHKSKKLSNENGESTIGESIAKMAWQAVEHYRGGCHFALITLNANNQVVQHLIRYNSFSLQPLILIDVSKSLLNELHSHESSLKGVSTTVCRAFLIDFSAGDDEDSMFRFLRNGKIHVWSDAWVVLIGRQSKANESLRHFVFRNSRRPVFLGLSDRLLKIMRTEDFARKNGGSTNAVFEREDRYISVYSRCLYCDKGYPSVKLLFRWQLGSDLQSPLNPFPDQFADFHGRRFRTVSMPTFPFNSYPVNPKENAPKIILDDCLDQRLLATLSTYLNFTYETYAPWTQQFGVRTESGNWTGLIGTIQFNIADFTTIVAPTRERFEIIDTTRVYLSDVLSVVSLKPDLIPQYLVIVRPFKLDVWLYVVLSIVVWAFTLWLFQRIWAGYSGGRAVSLDRCIFYSWSIILENAPDETPKNITARILLAVWLIGCLVTTTGFRSSLVAHLGVQGKTKPIDSFRDLVEKKNFKWGIEAYYLTGLPLNYFQTTTDPVVQEVYKHIEPLENNEIAFEKIIKGSYALVTFEMRAHTIINSYYTDNYGNTAYYVSKEGYSLVPYFGWGYGKGTPFRDRFGMIQARLNDAGIIDYWTKDVIAMRVRTNRKEMNSGSLTSQKVQINQIPGQQAVKLRVIHLAGVFLILLLGYIICFLIFLGERLMAPTSKVSHK